MILLTSPKSFSATQFLESCIFVLLVYVVYARMEGETRRILPFMSPKDVLEQGSEPNDDTVFSMGLSTLQRT